MPATINFYTEHAIAVYVSILLFRHHNKTQAINRDTQYDSKAAEASINSRYK